MHLAWDLHSYQNTQGKIQVLKYSQGPISKPIYLKFTHNDLKPVENYYDVIIHNQLLIENQEEILQSKSTVASKSMEQNKPGNFSNQHIFNFLTSNNKVYNHQEVNSTIGKGKVTSEQMFTSKVKDIHLESVQIFNSPVSYSQITHKQIFGPRDNKQIFGPRDHENIQSTQPTPAHQKGQLLDLTNYDYDSSEVLDLTQKTATTSSPQSIPVPVATNHDYTIIYEIPYEQEVQVHKQQEPQHEESTYIGRGKYFPMYLLDNIKLEIVTTIPEDIDGTK